MTLGEFIFIVNGELVKFTDYNDIPTEFDHVIKFAPDIPDGPHTPEEHDLIETWNVKFQQLMEIERCQQ
jgi:hypothetical protein